MPPKILFPTPRATPKSSTSKKRKSSRTSLRRHKKIRRTFNLKKRAKKLAKIRSGKVINVANDKERLSKSYLKQKVTKSQQKAINKRFREGYSPFIKNITNQLQLTSNSEVNKCKWIWRSYGHLSDVVDAFKTFPTDTNVSGSSAVIGVDYYISSQEQSIYFNQFKYIYEIMNPTNYDMDLIIYDIVYKQDTLDNHCNNAYWESSTSNNNALAVPSQYNSNNNIYENPIALINTGCHGGAYGTGSGVNIMISSSMLSDPTNIEFDSLNMKPTYSYPFNIYCKIIKKHRFRLQPGSTMTHVFTHKPKCMFNRGYLYKYKNTVSNAVQDDYRAIKDLTSGCLFKFSGQILNSGSDTDVTQVLNAAGKLVIKERLEIKWYAMNSKFSYIFNSENNWNGTVSGTSKLANLEVVNSDSVKPIKEVNMDTSDNIDTATSST